MARQRRHDAAPKAICYNPAVNEKRRLRVLVSNDDGIFSEGLAELANVLSPWCDVTVVVPDTQQSASSHAITLHKPLRLHQLDEIAPGVPTFVASGSPTDSVVLGLDYVLKGNRPDLVLSGINKGGNTAEDVSYSGTVAAAMEGAICRIPSVAISLNGDKRVHYNVAALAALGLVYRIAYCLGLPLAEKSLEMVPQKLRIGCPAESAANEKLRNCGGDGWPFYLCNVNVPDLPEAEIKGWHVTALGKRDYRDVVVEKFDPRGRPYFWIAGEEVFTEDPPGSDLWAVREGYISVTPLLLDYTDFDAVRRLSALFGQSGLAATRIALGNGSLSLEELNLLFEYLPADLTFVGEGGEIAFYSEKDEYIFPREPKIIGSPIENCHSEKSMDELMELMEDFKSGRRDYAENFREKDGRLIHVRYIAVRDKRGEYRGILETAMDLTFVMDYLEKGGGL